MFERERKGDTREKERKRKGRWEKKSGERVDRRKEREENERTNTGISLHTLLTVLSLFAQRKKRNIAIRRGSGPKQALHCEHHPHGGRTLHRRVLATLPECPLSMCTCFFTHKCNSSPTACNLRPDPNWHVQTKMGARRPIMSLTHRESGPASNSLHILLTYC